MKILHDKATSYSSALQTKIDELQKSLDGAQNDLKEEIRLKNHRNEEILKISNDLKARQKELNHEVKSRVTNIKERDEALNELKSAKTKLEKFEQKNEELNAQLSNAVEFRHDAEGEENFSCISLNAVY